MSYIITKKDLQESLIKQLVEAVRGKEFSFFTDSMNRVFIEQTYTIKNEYFFELLEDLRVFEEEVYMLEDNQKYEDAFKEILKMIEKDFILKDSHIKVKKRFIHKVKAVPIEEDEEDEAEESTGFIPVP